MQKNTNLKRSYTKIQEHIKVRVLLNFDTYLIFVQNKSKISPQKIF
jgi:uncharacterized protein YgfB (UPF0149 family)